MPGSGTLVVICGIDGSGKTVQSELLCERARRAGRAVRCIEFPRYDGVFFGGLIARYLRGEFSEDPASVNPYLAALPFACDRWEAAPRLRDWLGEGALVVCNRYVSANLAHQGGKIQSPEERREFCDWVEKLEYDVFKLPRPGLHVWLDMPPEIAVELIAGKSHRDYLRGETSDIHERDLAHLKATREIYRELAEREEGWLRVDCAAGGEPREAQRIADEVGAAVDALLSGAARA